MEFYVDDKKSTCDLAHHSNVKLSDLLEKTQSLQKLQAIFNSFVTEALATHCIVANYEKETLVLLTDSASWSTKIRFTTPELLKQLKTTKPFSDIKKIKCKIRPKENESVQIKKRKLMNISPENARMIKTMANTIKDERLRKSLLNLAND